MTQIASGRKPLDPRRWREAAGLSMTQIALKAGITGKNPARTYERYERGMHDAPPALVETVRRISKGAIGPEAWHAVRLRYLKQIKVAACRKSA